MLKKNQNYQKISTKSHLVKEQDMFSLYSSVCITDKHSSENIVIAYCVKNKAGVLLRNNKIYQIKYILGCEIYTIFIVTKEESLHSHALYI